MNLVFFLISILITLNIWASSIISSRRLIITTITRSITITIPTTVSITSCLREQDMEIIADIIIIVREMVKISDY